MRSLRIFAPLFIAAALSAQNPYANNPKEADAGRGLFRILCAPCHGIQAQGGRGPDLTLGVYNNGNSDSDLFRVVAHGVPGTEMPGYASRFGEDNVWRMISYIRSISTRNQSPPQGDPSAGERIYWGKGNCGACHVIGNKGGPMGPDLSKIGRKRSLNYLQQSITDPNADLTPGFYKITVTTRSGQRITGTQRNFDNFSAQLMTVEGKLHTFLREDVASVTRDYSSLMPSYQAFTESEMNHLLAYLLSLRGESK